MRAGSTTSWSAATSSGSACRRASRSTSVRVSSISRSSGAEPEARWRRRRCGCSAARRPSGTSRGRCSVDGCAERRRVRSRAAAARRGARRPAARSRAGAAGRRREVRTTVGGGASIDGRDGGGERRRARAQRRRERAASSAGAGRSLGGEDVGCGRRRHGLERRVREGRPTRDRVNPECGAGVGAGTPAARPAGPHGEGMR